MLLQRQCMINLIVLLLCAVSSACAGRAQPSHVLPSVTLKRTVKSADSSPTPTSTARASATPQPSPTFTATPRITRTPRYNPQGTATSQAWALLKTQVAGFPSTCEKPGSSFDSVSPGGSWLASSCSSQRSPTLEIVNHAGKRWVLQYMDYLAEADTRHGMPEGYLHPIRWTSDESYLYFTSKVALDGGGICFYGFGVSGLFRIDLNNGAVSAILPARDSWDGYKYAFSPGGRWLAYGVDEPAILDFTTGEKVILEVGKAEFSDFVWSPDGSKLAYATCQVNEGLSGVKKSSAQIFDLTARRSSTIFELEGNILYILARNTNGQLDMSYRNLQTNQYVDLFYDWSYGVIITPTPTP